MTWEMSLPFHRLSTEKVVVEDGHEPPVVSPLRPGVATPIRKILDNMRSAKVGCP